MITIDWGNTYKIFVPQSYLTFLGGSTYSLDVNQFRLDLKNLEDSVEGMSFPKTHNHNTEVVLSGVTYARTFEVISPYSVEFEDGFYTVTTTGANHNIGDTKVPNSVSLVVNNSAGLVSNDSKTDIANAVWSDNNTYNNGEKGEDLRKAKVKSNHAASLSA